MRLYRSYIDRCRVLIKNTKTCNKNDDINGNVVNFMLGEVQTQNGLYCLVKAIITEYNCS
jgi:hypothetical protein